MSIPEEEWSLRLHAAVDEHPAAVAFDAGSYIAAGRKRLRRRRIATVVASAASVAVVGAVAALVAGGMRDETLQPATPEPVIRTLGTGANGWVAVEGDDGGGIHLLRPGGDARSIDLPRSGTADGACPTWSPDGTRLIFGRLIASSPAQATDAELVVLPVASDGAPGDQHIIPLDGFGALEGFDPHPCATWAPDGRWVALRGPGDVWVVDTQTSAIRRLPGLRPIDLEWRPGTDELAIAGDMGSDRTADWVSTPISVYTVSTSKLRHLGSVHAGNITWSPDGRTLAYTGAERSAPALRLVDANGQNDRVLVDDPGTSEHGIGPVWSPTGDLIVYQRTCCGSSEGSEVVLVHVPEGTQTVIDPPTTRGQPTGGPASWYPFLVTWSPDGTTLLYVAWAAGGGQERLLTVPVDRPNDVVLLPSTANPAPGYKDHRWVATQMWGRQPE